MCVMLMPESHITMDCVYQLTLLAFELWSQYCKNLPSFDGIKPKQASAMFRSRLKDELITANVIGVAMMLASAGFPKPSNLNLNYNSQDDVAY